MPKKTKRLTAKKPKVAKAPASVNVYRTREMLAERNERRAQMNMAPIPDPFTEE